MTMSRDAAFSWSIASTILLSALGAEPVVAQSTPGAIPDPGSYQGSMQLQQEQDRQAQQNRQQSPQASSSQPQGSPSGGSLAPSSSRRGPDCQDRLARHPDLAPLANKVYLGHPDVDSKALFGIQSVPTAAERPLLLRWLAGRRSCVPELERISQEALASGAWTAKAKRANDLAAEMTNDMILQLADGKITYGQFNRQRNLNAQAVARIP
jgi:hypothetical protein